VAEGEEPLATLQESQRQDPHRLPSKNQKEGTSHTATNVASRKYDTHQESVILAKITSTAGPINYDRQLVPRLKFGIWY